MKYIILILCIGWLFGQLFRYFLRSKLGQFAQQVKAAAREEQRARQRATKDNGEIHVDYVPKEYQKRSKKDIRGGEYVDYEEVKD
ncbi:DUF4834 family protein [Echinicola shivajiensis]|uniref:DUF4834 family protein n=1 Tax=Echinicola shivajiensis TaxID=1035916 RepID=UPI001BFCB5A1|nr:DUF4834 family protein [Echinicola shivajiensis]